MGLEAKSDQGKPPTQLEISGVWLGVREARKADTANFFSPTLHANANPKDSRHDFMPMHIYLYARCLSPHCTSVPD